jgi:L-amino acid N-acyltransferase YncA
MDDFGKVAGWTALTPVSGRCIHAGVAEVNIYIGEEFRGKHVGLQLLTHLIHESEKNDIWTLQAGIFRQKIGDFKSHKRAGFRVIGFREKIGKLNGEWQNNFILEKRSKIEGI